MRLKAFLWFDRKVTPLLDMKTNHIYGVADDVKSYRNTEKLGAIGYHCYGGTPLNNPPIEIHANSSMFALIFWPHVTIFCIFWVHECLKWILEFYSKSLFWCQSRQIFEVRAIEQRHHEFQLIPQNSKYNSVADTHASSPVLTTISFRWPITRACSFWIFF